MVAYEDSLPGKLCGMMSYGRLVGWAKFSINGVLESQSKRQDFAAAELKREKIFVWYDYLSCPQLLHDIELDEFGIQRGRFLDDSMNCEEGPLCVELIGS